MASIKINTAADMTPDAASRLFAWALGVADTVVKFDDYKVRLGDLTVPGVHYLAANGFNQSMADSVAGVESGKMSVAAAASEADGKRWAKFIAEAKLQPGATPEELTAAVVAIRRTKRYDAIVASSIPARDGGGEGRADPRTAWINKAALDEIAAKHAKAVKLMPKGAELKALTAKYVAAKAEHFAKLWDARNAVINAETTDEILGF